MRRTIILFLSILPFLPAASPTVGAPAAESSDGDVRQHLGSLRGTMVVPDGWRLTRGTDDEWRTVRISKPSESGGEPKPAGLEIRFAEDFETALGSPPSEYAQRRMEEQLNLHRPLAASRGVDGEYAWFDYTFQVVAGDGSGRVESIRRIRMLASDTRDHLYVLTFEADPTAWIRTKANRDVLFGGLEPD